MATRTRAEVHTRKMGRGASGLGLLTVPRSIMNVLPSPDEVHYTIDLTDEGILFRPVRVGLTTTPPWTKGN